VTTRTTRILPWACAAALLAVAVEARADEGELQPILAPAFSLLPRYGRLNNGGGVALSLRWGLRDAVALEGLVLCERFGSLHDPSYADSGTTASLYYDATRCTIAPGLALRLGARLVGSVGVGAGYRFETQSSRDFVSASNLLIGHLASTSRHALVGRVSGAVEYRVLDWLALGASAATSYPLVGGPREFDLTLSVLTAIYLYP